MRKFQEAIGVAAQKQTAANQTSKKNRDLLNTSDLAQILPAFLGIYGVKHGETHLKNPTHQPMN